jgi:hypothetical protein
VVKLFLDAMNPSEIELGLLVVRETERQVSEIDRQWELRRERVRYEAQLTERRYKAVDPDNHVIARTLEREWNDKLAEMEELDREHQQVGEREKLELTEEDRARTLFLAKDLPAVWSAETTSHAERKKLLRMVVREVTLSPIDVPRRMTRVQVLWETGATSDFTVPRKDKYVALITPPKALALLRRLFNEKKKDLEIAKELNRRGLKTGRDQPWDRFAELEARRGSLLEVAGHVAPARVGAQRVEELQGVRRPLVGVARVLAMMVDGADRSPVSRIVQLRHRLAHGAMDVVSAGRVGHVGEVDTIIA